MNPPKILELEEVFVPESLSESEDPPPLDEDPPSKSSASEKDDSASASNSTKFLPQFYFPPTFIYKNLA